jgi:hypothetical protein
MTQTKHFKDFRDFIHGERWAAVGTVAGLFGCLTSYWTLAKLTGGGGLSAALGSTPGGLFLRRLRGGRRQRIHQAGGRLCSIASPPF